MRNKNEGKKDGGIGICNITTSDKILAASAYVIWLPAFYIILTDKRKNKYLAQHGAQALLLWLSIILFSVIFKIILSGILSIVFVPYLYPLYDFFMFLLRLYAILCAILLIFNKDFKIPLISDITKKIA